MSSTASTDTTARAIRIGSLRPTDLDGSPVERRCLIPAGMTDKKALLRLQFHLNRAGVHGRTSLVTGPSLDRADPLGERVGILAPIGGAIGYGSDPDVMLHVLDYEQTPDSTSGRSPAIGEAIWDEGEAVSPLASHIVPNPKYSLTSWSSDEDDPATGLPNAVSVMALPIQPVNELDLVQQVQGSIILPDPDGDHPLWAVIVEGHFAGLSRDPELDENIEHRVITNTREFLHPQIHVFSS